MTQPHQIDRACQKCGGEIQGWTCQGCGQVFRENDAGALVFDAMEAVAWREKVLDELDRAWLHGRWDHPWQRAKAADAILALIATHPVQGGEG